MRRFKQFSLVILFAMTTLDLVRAGQGPRYKEKDSHENKNSSPNSGALHYDQRQSGKYNVQVNLKDVQIIAVSGASLGGDFGDYDYSYDYDQLTSKPILSLLGSLAGNKPSTTTGKPNSTTTTTSDNHKPTKPSKPSETVKPSETNKPLENYPTYIMPDQIPVQIIHDKDNKTQKPFNLADFAEFLIPYPLSKPSEHKPLENKTSEPLEKPLGNDSSMKPSENDSSKVKPSLEPSEKPLEHDSSMKPSEKLSENDSSKEKPSEKPSEIQSSNTKPSLEPSEKPVEHSLDTKPSEKDSLNSKPSEKLSEKDENLSKIEMEPAKFNASRRYSVEIMGKDETLEPSRPIRGKVAPKLGAGASRRPQRHRCLEGQRENGNCRRINPGFFTIKRLMNIANLFKDKEDRDD